MSMFPANFLPYSSDTKSMKITDIAHLRQECRNSKLGIFELLV